MYYALPFLQKPRTVCNTNIAKQRTNEIQFFTAESYNLPIQTKQLFVLKDKTKRMTMIEKYLSMFPILSERKNQLAGNLSGGEQQMLAMARALMSSPSLLLLDEPTMGLSPVMVLKLFEIIKKIREEGTTILLVEQNAKIAIKLCDRGYVMNNGEITMSGSSLELENNEQIKEAYLGV